jgi:heme-degrading monooxygenase HmoA
MEGPSPPKRVGLTEWDSLKKAEAFFKSKVFTELPDREKAIKTIRRYAVEVAN